MNECRFLLGSTLQQRFEYLYFGPAGAGHSEGQRLSRTLGLGKKAGEEDILVLVFEDLQRTK